MDISSIFIGTMVLAVVAAVLGLSISIITQLFEIKEDPKITEIYEILPHYNCGACGHPGCMPYATAIINDNDAKNKCKPGGQKVADKILELLS